MLCQCYSCVATIQSDVNCTSKWVLHSKSANEVASGNTYHALYFSLRACQNACEFDPRCVAVELFDVERLGEYLRCYLNTVPNHNHSTPSECVRPPPQYSDLYECWEHYHLVSRCNITPGQYFDNNVFATVNMLIN